MIILSNVYKAFKDNVIFHDLNLNIKDNEFVAITGQSGCGKTTLLNLLGLLDGDFKGEYILDDVNISSLNIKKRNKIRREKISFVFQDKNLFDYLTVYENIIMPLKYNRKEIDDSEIDRVLNDLGIFSLKYRKANRLSGGEKQRVAIARALIQKTKYLFLDEPTGSLDDDNTYSIVNLIRDLKLKYLITIIVVTHNRTILHYFDNVYEIRQKGIKQNV